MLIIQTNQGCTAFSWKKGCHAFKSAEFSRTESAIISGLCPKKELGDQGASGTEGFYCDKLGKIPL